MFLHASVAKLLISVSLFSKMEIEKYRSEHPDFNPEPIKNVLSKAEKELKDRCDGKPERPPKYDFIF